MGYGVKTYYGVRESPNAILLPLQEHRDVCHSMRTSKFRLEAQAHYCTVYKTCTFFKDWFWVPPKSNRFSLNGYKTKRNLNGYVWLDWRNRSV